MVAKKVKSFYTDVIQKDKRYNSTKTINDISLLEPGTRAAAAKMILLAHQAGHELRVGETYRSQARQTQVYNQGFSQLKKVGCHGYGIAVDLQLLINGKYDPNGEHYTFLEKLCRECNMISGIDWGKPKEAHSFHDWDHIQRVPLFRQNDLFAGIWYPEVNYSPWDDEKSHGISF